MEQVPRAEGSCRAVRATGDPHLGLFPGAESSRNIPCQALAAEPLPRVTSHYHVQSQAGKGLGARLQQVLQHGVRVSLPEQQGANACHLLGLCWVLRTQERVKTNSPLPGEESGRSLDSCIGDHQCAALG